MTSPEQTAGPADPRQVSELILENVSEAVILTGLDMRVRRWSRGAERLYGWTRDEALGRPIHELIRPGDAPEQMEATVQRALAAGQLSLTDRRRRKDGTWLIVASSFTVLRDGQGQPVGILTVARDVTSSEEEHRLLRASESELREAQLHLARHLENTPLAVIGWDGDYRISAFGGRASEMFGWSAPEVLGKRIDEVPWVPEADWPIVRAVMSDLSGRQRPVHVSANRNLRKDGSVIHCEWHNSALYDAEGRLTSVFSLVQDVTDRVEAEQSHRRSEALLQAVVKSMSEGLVVRDGEGKAILANPAAARTLGVTEERLRGASSADMPWRVYGEDGEELPVDRRPVRETLRTGQPVGRLVRVVTEDGRERWCMANSTPVASAEGGLPRGVALTLTDITDLRQSRAQLQASEARLVRVFEGSSDGYFELDVASGRMMTSDRILEMLGLAPDRTEPLLGAWLERIHPDDVGECRAKLQEVLDGRAESMDVQGRVRSADGTWRCLQTRAKVFEGADGGTIVAGAVTDITTRKAAEDGLRQASAANEKLVQELREALASVKTLSGLIPLCMYCKKVRDDAGYWERLESYITKHSGALVSHGICTECTKKHFPEDT